MKREQTESAAPAPRLSELTEPAGTVKDAFIYTQPEILIFPETGEEQAEPTVKRRESDETTNKNQHFSG